MKDKRMHKVPLREGVGLISRGVARVEKGERRRSNDNDGLLKGYYYSCSFCC